MFDLDVLACSRSGGRLSVIATMRAPLAVQAILAYLVRSSAPAAAPDHSGSGGDRDGHARLRAPRGGHYPVFRLAAAGKPSSRPPWSRPTRRLSFLWPAPLSLLLDREPAALPAASEAAGDRGAHTRFRPLEPALLAPPHGSSTGVRGGGRTWPDPDRPCGGGVNSSYALRSRPRQVADDGRPRGRPCLAATCLIRAPSRSPVRRQGGLGWRAAGLVRVRRRPAPPALTRRGRRAHSHGIRRGTFVTHQLRCGEDRCGSAPLS